MTTPQTESLGPEPATGNYFVSAYPPFSVWTGEQVARYEAALQGRPRDPAAPWGLYVHVPFCVERCHFCYYLSHDRRPEQIDRTVDAIVAEAGMYAATPAFAGRRPGFVYFGGGTPSLLSVSQVSRLIGGLRDRLEWSDGAEVSFECAPRSVTPRKSTRLREHGVTRISLGVQQMDDDVLQANGRVHLIDDVERAWHALRQAEFDVLNLDLISGLVGETDRSFDDSLERVIDLAPDSVTIYQLEIPANTPLFRACESDAGSPAPASWPVKRERLRRGMARLEQVGYDVRSAYTAARTPAARRFVYQDAQYHGAELLGLGVSAFGFVEGIHQQNHVSLKRYLEAVESGALPLGRAHELDGDERLVREFVLQLKLGEIDRQRFETRHRVDVTERFREPLQAAGRAGWLTVTDRKVTLSRDGLLRVDRLIPGFYGPEHQGVRYS